MARNTEKYEKLEINTAGPGLWQEKLKNVEIETQTLYDLEQGEKHSNMWKKRNVHYRTQNMTRKLNIMKNEKHTQQDMKYGKKH